MLDPDMAFIVDAMHAFARQAVRHSLEVAAENATASNDDNSMGIGTVDTDSILSCQEQIEKELGINKK